MKAREIKALHEAVYTYHHLLLQYSNRILDDMPDVTMNITKAMYVEQAYDAAQWDNISSEGCYALAIAAANEFGGVEIYNSNDGQSRGISFAPTRTFTFDDSSSAQISYGGVFVIC